MCHTDFALASLFLEVFLVLGQKCISPGLEILTYQSDGLGRVVSAIQIGKNQALFESQSRNSRGHRDAAVSCLTANNIAKPPASLFLNMPPSISG